MSIVMSKETIYTDELIRENARLIVQHEADKLTIEALRQQVQDLERYAKEAEEAGAMCNAVQKEAAMMKAELDAERAAYAKLLKDMHFVMAGGDPCKVCAKVCMMGEGNCQPEWTGEKTEDCAHDPKRTVPALLPQPGD